MKGFIFSRRLPLPGAALLVFALVFTACDNTVTPPPGDTTPPAEVTGLNAVAGNGRITLTWIDPADSDLDYLEITWAGGSVTVVKSTAADRSNSKVITGLTNGTSYSFTIKAVDTSGNKRKGETATATPYGDTTPPAAVTGLAASAGEGRVTLTWIDPADEDLGYLEITWTGGSATAAKSAAADRSNSKVILGLSGGIAYAFTVKAVDSSGNKSQGETTSATPSDDITPPAEVTGLSAAAGDGRVTLTWTDPVDDDLDHIEISWADGSVTVQKSPAGDRSNSETVTGLTNGTAYTFTVKAVDASGNESQDETATVTPVYDNTPPAEVTGLAAVAAIKAITLTWIDPADDDLDHIEISWTGGSVTVEKSTTGDLSNSKTVTGLTGGTTYVFTVKAVDISGNESQGETAMATPAEIGTGTVIAIANTEDWTNALTQINTGGSGTISDPKVYTLDIQGAVYMPYTSATIAPYHIIVRFTGSGTLSLLDTGSIIRVGNSTQTFIIDGPTLRGQIGYTQGSTSLVYVRDGTVELLNGTISDNYGGGVYVAGDGRFTMSGGEISGNLAFSSSSSVIGGGGGVHVAYGGTFTMSGGKISGNGYDIIGGGGGGVYVADGGTFTMSGGEISGNTVKQLTMSDGGGGVYVADGGTFTMSGGKISGHTISSPSAGAPRGGGVYVAGGTFTMSGGEISGNTISSPRSNGGGVYVASGTFTMSNGEISGNTVSFSSSNAWSYGGGVYVNDVGTFTMSGGKISENTASSSSSDGYGGGGGVCAPYGGTFTMSGGEISGNTASSTTSTSSGGGVYFVGTFTMNEGIINDNTSTSYGGGVYVGGTFIMNKGTINGNTSTSSGGGVYVVGTFTMHEGIINGNTSSSGGGVHVYFGPFTKTGGIIYGDTDHIVDNGNATDNTATSTSNLGTNGHGVLYYNNSGNCYYRNGTLADDASGNINTTDALPAESGEVLNNWTKR